MSSGPETGGREPSVPGPRPAPHPPRPLPKAADALKLFLPFQKPSGFYKYHFGSEYSGGFSEV